MCRKTATELTKLQPTLNKLGVKLIAVINSECGVEEFQKYFGGEVYLDPKLEFFRKSCLKLEWKQLLHATFTVGAVAKLRSQGISGDLVAPDESKHHLDSIFVVGKDGKTHFSHQYKLVTDYPNDWEAIVTAATKASQ